MPAGRPSPKDLRESDGAGSDCAVHSDRVSCMQGHRHGRAVLVACTRADLAAVVAAETAATTTEALAAKDSAAEVSAIEGSAVKAAAARMGAVSAAAAVKAAEAEATVVVTSAVSAETVKKGAGSWSSGQHGRPHVE